jgi:hypothetical protein
LNKPFINFSKVNQFQRRALAVIPVEQEDGVVQIRIYIVASNDKKPISNNKEKQEPVRFSLVQGQSTLIRISRVFIIV